MKKKETNFLVEKLPASVIRQQERQAQHQAAPLQTVELLTEIRDLLIEVVTKCKS